MLAVELAQPNYNNFTELQANEWAYQELAELNDRNNCAAKFINYKLVSRKPISRWEAAAILSSCIVSSSQITDQIKQLLLEFEQELAISNARVDGLEAKLAELEASQFSTTTKLNGVARLVMGDAYRGAGSSRFGEAKNLAEAAALYATRSYNGALGGPEPKWVQQLEESASRGGEAYSFYRAEQQELLARQMAFHSGWTGYTPSYVNTTSSSAINAFGDLAANNVMHGVGKGQNLWLPQYEVSVNRTRLSIFTEDGYSTALQLPSSSITLQYLKPNISSNLILSGDQLALEDRYGRRAGLKATTNGSANSNITMAKIHLDSQDMAALINLANQSRRIKQYSYYGETGTLTTKAAGILDPIQLSSTATRQYQAQTSSGSLVNNFSANGEGLVVTPGGAAINPTIYNNVINYLVAEYGSLSPLQRQQGYVKAAAQKLIQNLAAYPNNQLSVGDRNAFTFSHDVFLNFNTSFTGKDLLVMRLRSNSTYSFAKRTNNPATSISYDAQVEDWPNNETKQLAIDKLYVKWPLSQTTNLVLGSRFPQEAVLPSRGTFYPRDALLEFFNSAAGLYPSFTATGSGLTVGPWGSSGISAGIAVLSREADAADPSTSRDWDLGWFGENTRIRIPMQLAWQSADQRWVASAGYAWERGNNAMAQVGTSLALSPFFNPNLNISQQWGITFAHQANSKIGISAAYARSKATSRAASSFLGIAMTAAGDSAETQSWMLAVNVNDLIAKGNNAGFGVGGVPTVYSNRSGWGVDGAMPIALEAWYQWRLTDSLSITPGAFHISASANKNGFDGGASWGGVIKTQFNF